MVQLLKQVERGVPVIDLLSLLARGTSSEPTLEQRVTAVEGMVNDHEIAIIVERIQAHQHTPTVRTSPEYFSMDAADSKPNMSVPMLPKVSQDAKFKEPFHYAVEVVAPVTSTSLFAHETPIISPSEGQSTESVMFIPKKKTWTLDGRCAGR